MKNEFIVFPKMGRMLMLALLSIVFVLLGVVCIVFSMGEDTPFWAGIIGAITVVFFGLCALYYVKELVIRKPALIISDEGIVDRSSFIGAGFVSWEDIQRIDFFKFNGQLFLSIFTHDKDLIIKRTSGIKRSLNRMNKGLLPSQVNIPAKNLACSLEKLTEEINNRRALYPVDVESK